MKAIMRLAAIAFCFHASVAAAEPVKLKFAYFGSDQAAIYVQVLKPFVEAVNAEGKGVVEIEPFTGGALGRSPPDQVKLLQEGTADLAFVVPAYTPQLFAGGAVIQLPGLFRDVRDATLTFSRLIARNALPGYEGFYALGAFASEPETIHTKAPLSGLGDLKGLRIRVNNPGEAAALSRLGAVPTMLPLNVVSDAISAGTADGAVIDVTALGQFGIQRVTSTHYLLPVASAQLAVLMTRQRFDALPEAAKAILRKHGGEALAQRFIDADIALHAAALTQLSANPARKVIKPSADDLATAKLAFSGVVDQWLAASPDNAPLLAAVRAEIARLTPTQ